MSRRRGHLWGQMSEEHLRAWWQGKQHERGAGMRLPEAFKLGQRVFGGLLSGSKG